MHSITFSWLLRSLWLLRLRLPVNHRLIGAEESRAAGPCACTFTENTRPIALFPRAVMPWKLIATSLWRAEVQDNRVATIKPTGDTEISHFGSAALLLFLLNYCTLIRSLIRTLSAQQCTVEALFTKLYL